MGCFTPYGMSYGLPRFTGLSKSTLQWGTSIDALSIEQSGMQFPDM